MRAAVATLPAEFSVDLRCPPVQPHDCVTDPRWPHTSFILGNRSDAEWWNQPKTHRYITSVVRERVLIYEDEAAPPRRPDVQVAPHLLKRSNTPCR